mmetsp:Transcript_19511/g.58975  ORF Transcript_19511/g.58975 Transcript_19511/m.58975 type:complete len:228 (-) Transcript_19511:1091-1774(-)
MLARVARGGLEYALAHQRAAATKAGGLPRGTEWKLLQLQGELINPCDSPLHPSVREAKIKPSAEEKPIQQSYAGESHCFGCGPHNPDGLQLKSYRIKNGLSAKVILQNKWMCFPGIASGGIITTLFDCHGNWTAAISLMDKQCLPRPPLTLTSEMLVNFRAPTPADEELVVRSQVVAIRDKDKLPPGVKPQVQVDLELLQQVEGSDEMRVLATATGIFKRMGALRAL